MPEEVMTLGRRPKYCKAENHVILKIQCECL